MVLWLPICRGTEDTPDFGHAFSNYTYFRPRGPIWFSSVQRAHKVADEKRRKKKEESLVKYKSTRSKIVSLVIYALAFSLKLNIIRIHANRYVDLTEVMQVIYLLQACRLFRCYLQSKTYVYLYDDIINCILYFKNNLEMCVLT